MRHIPDFNNHVLSGALAAAKRVRPAFRRAAGHPRPGFPRDQFAGWKSLWPVCQSMNAYCPAKFLNVTFFSSVKCPSS